MPTNQQRLAPLAAAAEYAINYRERDRPLHPTASADELRERFCVPLPDEPRDGSRVISDLIAAVEPGLVGNTDADFFAWVMGGSSPIGVAADWLTSIWGQNAAIYQTSPAAAMAEEAVADWVLDLLDLPRDASVGLVTGATMAAFVGLAAARTAVLARFGHDFEANGLQNAPLIRVYLSDDAHVTNLTAVRHIGLGDANVVRIPSDDQGRMNTDALGEALTAHDGPSIIVAQAGHINTGAFEDFEALSSLARKHDAWLHVDGAFGLWARAVPERAHLAQGVELADSWSVDGHKWMQVPYDSGFAIVRDSEAHRRAMDISASYLNMSEDDGRNPTHYSPGLSRRARGFAAWAVFQSLGRAGVRTLVERHCKWAETLAGLLSQISGLSVVNEVVLNQIVVAAEKNMPAGAIGQLAERLNANAQVFVRPTVWRGQDVLRISISNGSTSRSDIENLARAIAAIWCEIGASNG